MAMTDKINRYGYRTVVPKGDAMERAARARLDSLAVNLQRRRKSDGAPFIPLQIGDIENQWNGLIDYTQGKHPQMSAEAARACHEEVARVFKFRARAYIEDQPDPENPRRTKKVRRVAIEDIQLPTCECTGGAQHYDLCVEDALDAVKAVMQQVVDATDAEEAHNAAWAADALCTVLANHGITVNWWNIWRDVCPPLRKTVTRAEFERHKAWDARWALVGEDLVTRDVIIERDRLNLFQRAKSLISEQAARDERRPFAPPAEWTPPVGDAFTEPS
jgi:hypothetical protein